MKYIFYLHILLFTYLTTFSQIKSAEVINSPVQNHAFNLGEKMTYKLNYAFTAGYGVVEVKPDYKKVNGKVCYQTTIVGVTSKFFDVILKVRDSWTSLIDTATILPEKFIRIVSEGKYNKTEVSTFDKKNKSVSVLSKEKQKQKIEVFQTPPHTHDIVSIYASMRNLDYSSLKVGDYFYINTFFEDKVYKLKVRFLGRENLNTQFGTFKTFIMAPVMPKNRIFKGEDAIKFWVTDDLNKMLLQAKLKIKVIPGTNANLKLTSFKGLKYPLTSKIAD